MGSSEEFMGELRLRKLAKHVIQGESPVMLSHSDFGLVVQAFDDAAGELLSGPEVVEQQLAMAPNGTREVHERIDAGSHGARAPLIKELACR
jgi:hypothetical protein